jgi:beta-glucosidase
MATHSWLFRTLIAFALFAPLAVTSVLFGAQAQDASQIDAQVESMLQKLTLEQKLELIGGVDGMFIRAEPQLGMPALKMSDGPMGVRTWGVSTAYAAGIGLAASWDPSLAHLVGTGLGEDARARGVNFLLGPGVNIYRFPVNGRNFEYFGEDPFLAGRIAAAYIQGVQSKGVVATVKHYTANNSEYDRHDINEIIDERTLREIYLPAFEAAVKQGHVGAVMDAYELVNGEHMTQNRFLNVDVLKQQWGFRGILMSDWVATYNGVAAANAGLDLEMPSGAFMNPKTLLPAIQAGKVSVGTIDDKVRRILRVAVEFGFINHNQTELHIPLYSQRSREIALKAAEEGPVLLKNDNHVLPFDPATVQTIAVIGPDAYPAVPTAGGSAEVAAFDPVSFMTGLSDRLGTKGRVLWNRGVKPLSDVFGGDQSYGTKFSSDAAGKQPGLREQRFDNPNFNGNPFFTTTVFSINSWSGFQWAPPARRKISIRWTGYYKPQKSGEHIFIVAGIGQDAYTLYVNNKQVLKQTPHEGQIPQQVSIRLTAGEAVPIRLDYLPQTNSVTLGFGVTTPEDLIDPEAKKIAAAAQAVVVAVGFNPMLEGEGHDRTYALPLGQERLIREIIEANPRTVVTITSGGSVATQDWIDQAPAVLETWYSGESGGTALAKLLLGDISPSGKLPISWERKLEDNPCYHSYYEEPGTHDVKYSEGVFVGYRYYTSSNVKPLFPFGFGLSYTTFAFSNLSVKPDHVNPDDPITVSFDVRNTGDRAGAEVAQVYVGDPSATVKRPAKELKGFERVELNPGESKTVTVTLDKRSLAYWDTASKGWKVDPGKFIIYAGDSSENTPLEQEITVQ